MFKTVMPLKINGDPIAFATILKEAEGRRFSPPSESTSRAEGWIPPRDKPDVANDPLAEPVGDFVVMAVRLWTKAIPAAALAKAVDKAAAELERQTGRKPGRKGMRELKQQVELSLLPQAFPRERRVMVAFHMPSGMIYTEATGGRALDTVLSFVAALSPTLNVHFLRTATDIQDCMRDWLYTGECGAMLTIDDAAKLTGENKQAITLKGTSLGTDAVKGYLTSGMAPASLAVTFDGRLSCALSESMAMRSVSVIGASGESGDDAWGGTALMTLATIHAAYDHLIDLAGGEEVLPIEAAAKDGDEAAGGDDDALIEAARALVVQYQTPSISLVQRHLRIGYNRAARLLEALEKRGVVTHMGTDGRRHMVGQTEDAQAEAAAAEA